MSLGGWRNTATPRIIGWGHALDMMLTGRRLNAAEALVWGLVTEVVPDNHLYERA